MALLACLCVDELAHAPRLSATSPAELPCRLITFNYMQAGASGPPLPAQLVPLHQQAGQRPPTSEAPVPHWSESQEDAHLQQAIAMSLEDTTEEQLRQANAALLKRPAMVLPPSQPEAKAVKQEGGMPSGMTPGGVEGAPLTADAEVGAPQKTPPVAVCNRIESQCSFY
jgi:hypothetical protein